MRATRLILLAWLAWIALDLARAFAARTVPNAVAGDVVQSAAFATLVGAGALGLARRAPDLMDRAGLALMIALLVVSIALGHPWRGLAGAPLLALALVPLALELLTPRFLLVPAAGLALVATGWYAMRAVAAEPDVALLSYVAPALVLVVAAIAAASWRSLKRRAPSRAAWT